MNTKLNTEAGICLLAVNDVNRLLEVTLLSILENSNSQIYIGYVGNKIPELAITNKQINWIELHDEYEIETDDHTYKSFGNDSFYKIVKLKWELISSVINLDHKFIIYNDLDVVWLREADKYISLSFDNFTKTDILIQSFTRNPHDPLLCMGFVALRNCQENKKLLGILKLKHNKMYEPGSQLGDDEVITKYYHESEFNEKIKELPQSTFPVGNFLDLYVRNSYYPGIPKLEPIIFHANYVIGIKSKLRLIYIILKKFQKTYYFGSTVKKIKFEIYLMKFVYLVKLIFPSFQFRMPKTRRIKNIR